MSITTRGWGDENITVSGWGGGFFPRVRRAVKRFVLYVARRVYLTVFIDPEKE